MPLDAVQARADAHNQPPSKGDRFGRLAKVPMPHQEAADDKLRDLKVGAILMEMRTGKTLVAARLALRKLRRGRASRVLWFCPVSAMDEIAGLLGDTIEGAKVFVFDDAVRRDAVPAGFDWHLIGIESLSSSLRIHEAAMSIAAGAVGVLDEAHLVSNSRAIRTRRLVAIGNLLAYRYILSGSLIGNGISDVYTPFYWLSPKVLGYTSWRHFAHHHIVYKKDRDGKKYPVGTKNEHVLAARIAPYTYQVRKEDCLSLPPKNYGHASFQMTAEQRRLYGVLKDEFLSNYDAGSTRWGTIDAALFRLFTALQRCVSGYWRDTDGESQRLFAEPEDNPRIQALLDVVCCIASDRKVVIWAKYLWEVEDIIAALERAFPGAGAVPLTGRVRPRDRSAALERFRTAARFLVGSTAIGGQAIDLVVSSDAVYYSNTFSWWKRAQSEDRQHGPGQTLPVGYTDIVCSGSIDERIRAALGRKQGLADYFRKEVDAVKAERDRMAALKKLTALVRQV